MAEFDYDLFVIGGGSGGVRAARIAAQHGARVAIAEEHRYGGTCVIRGCVPKKLLVYAAGYRAHMRDARGYGYALDDDDVRFDWSTLIANKDREIDRLNKIYENLLEKNSVEVLHGRATVTGAHTLRVGDRTITAARTLVATGGRPFVPTIPGAALAISSNEAFHLQALPRHIAVIGGGYIAIEFAHIFAGLGAQVTLIHRRNQVLRGFDPDVQSHVLAGMKARGIALALDASVTAIDEVPATPDRPRDLVASLSTGATLTCDQIMCAIGRVPMTANMGLVEAGVELDEVGAVVVDDTNQSSVPSIFAIGDCTNRVNLTPVAIREGHTLADRLFAGKDDRVNYDNIPTAVFSLPPAASVGLSEDAARGRHHEVDIYRAEFRPMRNILAQRDERAMLKIVVDRQTDVVLGVHAVGDDAPEIIQVAAIALTLGATKAAFDQTMALHPTTAEELVLMRTPV